MPGAHRDGDSRFCGALTIASQSTVKVNGKPWSVNGDPSNHGAGNIICVYGAKNVRIGGILVACAVGDKAGADLAFHPVPPTDPKGHSNDVSVYSGAAGGGS
jgi:uncharacterized Zn-binding protein involved in type VI secretion